MAITDPTLTTNNGLAGFLTPAESGPIFADAKRMSAFQQLFRQTPLGISGQSIPVVTSRPTANWVAQGGKKPTTEMGFGKLTIEPKKMAAIAVLSAEVIRANPAGINGLLRPALAEAFAVAFDYAVGFNLGGDGTGTGPFSAYSLNNATKSVEIGTTTQANGGIHGDMNAALTLLVNDGKKLTGWALGDVLEPKFWGAVDTTGRPIFADLPLSQEATVLAQAGQSVARPGLLLNRPSWMGEGVANGTTKGFAGNFTKGAWGAVGGISYRVSTEATVTINGELTSLFENNLVAVLAEAEYGFANADLGSFVKLVDAV